MGACLSCLGLRDSSTADSDRARLFDPSDPYNSSNYGYGTQGGGGGGGGAHISAENLMSPEEIRRERAAMDNITRWATDQVVEIFPHQVRPMVHAAGQVNGDAAETDERAKNEMLLNMLPGDKLRRSIRVQRVPPRSSSGVDGGPSLRNKDSNPKLNGTHRGNGEGVLVKMKIDLP